VSENTLNATKLVALLILVVVQTTVNPVAERLVGTAQLPPSTVAMAVKGILAPVTVKVVATVAKASLGKTPVTTGVDEFVTVDKAPPPPPQASSPAATEQTSSQRPRCHRLSVIMLSPLSEILESSEC
jgi:hypothetical protein